MLLTPLLLVMTGAAAAPPGLAESAWVLSSLRGQAVSAAPPITLRIAEGQASGSDGCNRYSGPVALEGNGFRVRTDSMASTQMACPPEVMARASAYTTALGQARKARVEGRRLTLLGEDGAVLASFEAQSRDLSGTSWKVTDVNNGREAVVSVLQGSSLTLSFSRDGMVSGSAGCNQYSGKFTADGERVILQALASTRKTCPQPAKVLEQEAAFLRALQSSARARIEGDRLELRDAHGALMVGASRGGGGGADAGALGLRLPASFVGDLPCADCPGIRTHLDLWPDQAFHARQEYLGRSVRRDFLGRWRVDPARKALTLEGGAGTVLQLGVEGPNKLRLLDRQGKPIVSKLPAELVSDGTLQPTELELTLGGEMTYFADSPRVVLCATGRNHPIAMEADFLKAQETYRQVAKPPGSPLYVTFEGTIAQRPKMEGERTETAVVIRRFINAWPGQTCECARADAALVSTPWRIIRLGDTPVATADKEREPLLILAKEGQGTRYRATVGCNQLVGSANVTGTSLTFKPGAATQMACLPPLDALEKALSETLGRTRRYAVTGGTLELVDESGRSLALLEAVHL
jgi:copper homeostasis protein (lipoprotein)